MYKIIKDFKVVDIIRTPNFIRFLPTGHVAMTDKSSAHGIVGSDNRTIYSFGKVNHPNAKVVSIKEITLEEFNRLQSLLNSNQVVSADESELAKAKRLKIQQLSTICKIKIIDGFTLRLSDGDSHNFKLTIEDQLNLASLENQFNAGAKTFIYHATNEPCKVFMRNDMERIIKAFRRHTLYHTTYFNVAKQYINSLVDIDKVTNFTYGANVTGTTKDIALRQILKSGGVS